MAKIRMDIWRGSGEKMTGTAEKIRASYGKTWIDGGGKKVDCMVRDLNEE